jgi:hypothetical protein
MKIGTLKVEAIDNPCFNLKFKILADCKTGQGLMYTPVPVGLQCGSAS